MRDGQALIGQEQVRAQLARELDAVAKGRASLVLLAGEAGVGKTRLATELVLSPRTVEMRVANGLGKLGCRSRAEGVRRASDLRLLDAVEDTVV